MPEEKCWTVQDPDEDQIIVRTPSPGGHSPYHGANAICDGKNVEVTH